LDSVWIPETARHGWLIITRDRRILEVLMCQWRRIEAVLEEKGPLIYSVTRTSMRKLQA
jgi:hypothetical protein